MQNIKTDIQASNKFLFPQKRSQIGFLEMHHSVESNGDENILLMFLLIFLCVCFVFFFFCFKHLIEFDSSSKIGSIEMSHRNLILIFNTYDDSLR